MEIGDKFGHEKGVAHIIHQHGKEADQQKLRDRATGGHR